MPSLSSFTSSPFTSETRSKTYITGMIVGVSGACAAGYYSGATYSGNSWSSSPVGLFDALIFARNFRSTPKIGNTYDRYIEYRSAGSLVQDLNKLDGLTGTLVATANTGLSYYTFFKNNGDNTLTGQTLGNQFLEAVSYLAYGGRLVIASTPTGLDLYQTDNNVKINALMGINGNTSEARWVQNNPYSIGVFPSTNSGNGYTALGFDTLLTNSPTSVNFNTSTVANRLFNVYGQKTNTVNSSLLVSNSTTRSTLPTTSDICGFLARTNDRNELYLTIAGYDRATVLNGTVTNAVAWADDTIKNLLKANRVNYFLSYTNNFLGLDLVGATATDSAVIADERIGPAQMKTAMTRDITDIAMKYLYEINNADTRSSVENEIAAYLQAYAPFLDTTKTQIVCDSSNNTDNATTLNVAVTVTPLLGLTSFVVNINLSAT